MKPKSQPVQPIGCVAFFIIGILILGAIKCMSGNSTDKPTVEKTFVDDDYESTWRVPNQGDETIELAKLFSEKNIPCGDWLIKESLENKGTYLCACRVLYPDPWKYYKAWPSIGDVGTIDSWKVKNQPPRK